MVTGQGTEREQPVEEVPDKNVTVRVAELTETNATNEIRENTNSSDTEPLQKKMMIEIVQIAQIIQKEQ